MANFHKGKTSKPLLLFGSSSQVVVGKPNYGYNGFYMKMTAQGRSHMPPPLPLYNQFPHKGHACYWKLHTLVKCLLLLQMKLNPLISRNRTGLWQLHWPLGSTVCKGWHRYMSPQRSAMILRACLHKELVQLKCKGSPCAIFCCIFNS